LDDDYRVIVSREISEYYTSRSVKEYFIDMAGYKISMPEKYLPNKKYLETHRNQGAF